MIVTTHMANVQNDEAGNVAEIVVVRVDNPSSYKNDPGHSATGVVVVVAGG